MHKNVESISEIDYPKAIYYYLKFREKRCFDDKQYNYFYKIDVFSSKLLSQILAFNPVSDPDPGSSATSMSDTCMILIEAEGKRA